MGESWLVEGGTRAGPGHAGLGLTGRLPGKGPGRLYPGVHAPGRRLQLHEDAEHRAMCWLSSSRPESLDGDSRWPAVLPPSRWNCSADQRGYITVVPGHLTPRPLSISTDALGWGLGVLPRSPGIQVR